ncbi:hypothetical protein MMC22_001446 [Lobaria immixta]|nr:hypothetical protein [Lobaria immixta]
MGLDVLRVRDVLTRDFRCHLSRHQQVPREWPGPASVTPLTTSQSALIVSINSQRPVEIQEELTATNAALVNVTDQDDTNMDHSDRESTSAEDEEDSTFIDHASGRCWRLCQINPTASQTQSRRTIKPNLKRWPEFVQGCVSCWVSGDNAEILFVIIVRYADLNHLNIFASSTTLFITRFEKLLWPWGFITKNYGSTPIRVAPLENRVAFDAIAPIWQIGKLLERSPPPFTTSSDITSDEILFNQWRPAELLQYLARRETAGKGPADNKSPATTMDQAAIQRLIDDVVKKAVKGAVARLGAQLKQGPQGPQGEQGPAGVFVTGLLRMIENRWAHLQKRSHLHQGDEAASTNVEHWREFENEFSHVNVDLEVAMPVVDIADTPEGIWTKPGDLWPHRRWAIFGLPEVLQASEDENSADIKSAYLLGLWSRHEEGRQYMSKGAKMLRPRHKSRKRKAEKEARAKARKTKTAARKKIAV